MRSADRHMILRHLKIALIGKLRETEIPSHPFHFLWTTLTSFLNKYCICMGGSSRLVYLCRRKYFKDTVSLIEAPGLNSGHYSTTQQVRYQGVRFLTLTQLKQSRWR